MLSDLLIKDRLWLILMFAPVTKVSTRVRAVCHLIPDKKFFLDPGRKVSHWFTVTRTQMIDCVLDPIHYAIK